MRADGSPNRRQFLITTALVTALAGFLLVTSVHGVVDDLHTRDQEAAREAGVRARVLGDSTIRTVSDVQRTLTAGAGANSTEQLAAIIAGNNAVRSAAVFDEAGRLRLRTTPQTYMDATIGDQPMFTTLRDAMTFGLFVASRSHDSAKVALAATRINAPTGEFAGLVVAELALDNLRTLYSAAARNGSVALLGHQDHVIAAWPPPSQGDWTGRAVTELPAFAVPPRRFAQDDLAIDEREAAYIAAMRRASFGSTILVAVPRPAMDVWNIVRQPAIIMAGIVSLIAIALLMVLHRLSRRHDQSSAALRASEDRAARQLAELESLYNTAVVGLAFVDKDLRYRRINAHLAHINGLPQEAHIGRPLAELIPDLSKAVEPLYRRVLDSGEPITEQEISGTTPADPSAVRTWLAHYHPIRGTGDDVIGVNVVVQDVTDRKRAEAALRQSELRFRTAAECVSDLIYECDIRTGKILWFGDIDAHLGYAPGEVQRSFAGWEGLIHPDDRGKVQQAVARHLVTGGEAIIEYRVRRRDGADQIWSDRGRIIPDADGKPMLLIGAVADITERRRSMATERQLLDAIEHMSEGLALWGPDDRLVFCNERYRQLSGAAGPILVPGVTFTELLQRSMQAGLLDDAVGREEEWLAERMSKHRHPGEPVETKREGRWLRVYEHLVPDGSVIVALNDIHVQELQEEQLRQAQKMEAVGHLTGGVAHDFNNLLAVIVGNLELLEERTRPGSAERDMLAAALRASNRGAELTHRLLAFARRQPLNPEITDPRRLVDELVPMLRRTLGETIEIVSRAANDLGNVTADRGQLENVLINLCLNARDAMPKGGVLAIDLSTIELDANYAELQEEVRPGTYIVIAVSDTGTGMDAETRRRAFEPFFTTKGLGKGSGLGLSTAYGFAKQSGGHITIYSEIGHGTTIRLYFPRVRDATAAAQAAPHGHDGASIGNETILLVEDDADVRSLAATLLRGLGYQILEAANGAAALDVLASAGRIDLLLTDVILPGGMLGPTLAAEIERRRPGTRVLYMSGYTEDALIHGGRLDEGVELISKPFRKADLAAKIRSVLRGGTEA